jgi:hypothetical protein
MINRVSARGHAGESRDEPVLIFGRRREGPVARWIARRV